MAQQNETPRQRIRAIVFDAGGVLLHPSLDWIAKELAAEGVKRSVAELHHDYYRMIHAADLDAGLDRRGVALSSNEVRLWMFDRLLAAALAEPRRGRVVAPLAERAAVAFPGEGDIFYWSRPSLRGELEALRDAGFLLAVASNNDGSLEGQLARVGVTDLFAARLDSGVEGVAKPDPELLLRAAARLGVAAADCLYVGDIDRVDGAAARAAGMSFALLDPLAQPRPTAPLCIPSLTAILEIFSAAPQGVAGPADRL